MAIRIFAVYRICSFALKARFSYNYTSPPLPAVDIYEKDPSSSFSPVKDRRLVCSAFVAEAPESLLEAQGHTLDICFWDAAEKKVCMASPIGLPEQHWDLLTF